MGAVALRKSTYENASVGKRKFAELVLTKFALGVPAVFEDPNGVEYNVYHDSRFSARDALWFVWALENIAAMPDDLPDFDLLDSDNVWGAVNAGAPGWVKVNDSVPEGWVDPSLPPPEVDEGP